MPRNYQQGGVNVVALDERLTGDEIDDTVGAFQLAAGGGLPQVVVDLQSVRVVDSLGIECLCDFHDRCRKAGGEVRFASLPRLLRDVMRVTGVEDHLCLADNVITAAGEFAE